MDSDRLRIARDKLTRVFRYLEALNQHRNSAKRQLGEQPWSLWLRNLASLLAAALEQPEYRKNEAGQATSFGVVSLVGDEQALEIDNLLRKHIAPGRLFTAPWSGQPLKKIRPLPPLTVAHGEGKATRFNNDGFAKPARRRHRWRPFHRGPG